MLRTSAQPKSKESFAEVWVTRRASAKIAVVGDTPPPPGGVQSHVERLVARLRARGIQTLLFTPNRDQKREDYVSPDTFLIERPWWGRRKFNYWGTHWFVRYGWRRSPPLVHFHDLCRTSPYIAVTSFMGKRVVVTVHAQMALEGWQRASWRRRAAFSLAFRSPNVWWIAVNDRVKDQLLAAHVPERRIWVIPAYLPAPGDMSFTLPDELAEFIRSRHPIISTYGWRLCLDTTGVEIHCFHECIAAVRAVRLEYPDVGLIICLPVVGEPEIFARLLSLPRSLGVEDSVLFFTRSVENGTALWHASDVLLRATTTDGDSLSIREALSIGTPVVASDAAPRPCGVHTYPVHDVNAMIRAIGRALETKGVQTHEKQEDYFENILEVYRDAGLEVPH
jgi:glycogen(starch) synthase